MLAQAAPVMINLSSPLTIFVIVIVAVVVALAFTTRRANTRPGPTYVPPALLPGQRALLPTAQTGSWAAAQALFVDDPRAACSWAESLAASVLRDARLAPDAEDLAAQRYGFARAAIARPEASTDDLRHAFLEFRELFLSVTPRLGPAPDR